MTPDETKRAAVEILKQAREVLSDRKHWTQGDYAKDRFGNLVCSSSRNATCWCAIGAIFKLTEGVGAESSLAMEFLGEALPEDWKAYKDPKTRSLVPRYNDAPDRKHEDILALYDKAIEIGEKP